MCEHQRGENILDAIERRDAAALRIIAQTERSEKGRMWLMLLTRMLELDSSRRGRHAKRSSRRLAPIIARRVQRRAG